MPAPGPAPADRPAESAPAVWLFPGLGARHVGMGADLIGKNPIADHLLEEASDWLGYSVPAVCLEGSGRKHVPLRQEAQVLYAVDCAYAAALAAQGHCPALVAGHSLGSFAAAYAAGAFDFLTGLELVTRLEDLMETLIDNAGLRPAAQETESAEGGVATLVLAPVGGARQAMAAIIGLPEARVEQLCAAHSGVYLANQNSDGQTVIAGPASEVDAVLAAAAAAGAYKVKRLPAGRAMHTPHLREVSRRFAGILRTYNFRDLSVPFLDCDAGKLLGAPRELQVYLAAFLSRPVRWEAAMRSLREQGRQSFVEVGPATVLTDLMRFIDRGAAVRPASEVLVEELRR